jgi:hypothetical protein
VDGRQCGLFSPENPVVYRIEEKKEAAMPCNIAPTHVPSYRHHKPTGQAVVTLSGQDLYLGKWNTKASRDAYDRLIGEWMANGRSLPQKAENLTVAELALRYRRFAESYYRKEGRPTGSIPPIRVALRLLRRSYGTSLAADLGPLAPYAAPAGRIVLSNHVPENSHNLHSLAVANDLLDIHLQELISHAAALIDNLYAALYYRRSLGTIGVDIQYIPALVAELAKPAEELHVVPDVYRAGHQIVVPVAVIVV